MSIQKRINSFQFAIQGLGDLVKSQPNARIHLMVGIAVLAAGYFCRISKYDWIAVILCMALVISLEAVNTALEYLTDLVSPQYHPLAGKAKDVAAAAVLIAAMGAVVVGLLIFVPYLLPLLSKEGQ
jgi:diacylglycerol kinase